MHNDNVNHPNHYTSGPFECIELTSRYPFLGGNAIKYVYRWQGKNGLEDLRKAPTSLLDSIRSTRLFHPTVTSTWTTNQCIC